MARSPWGTFSSFLRRGHASSVDTAGLALPEAMGEEDENELPTLSGANKLRLVLRDEEAVCNGAGADPNPGQGAGVPEEPPQDTRASEQKCNRCSKTFELTRQKAVKQKLWIAMTLYVVFTVGEFIGGYLSNSLAVMTDAVHTLADVLGIAASLVALFLAGRPPSSRFTFGLHRFEALAAVLSVMLIYAVTIGLIYEAVQRTIHQDFEIQADVMIIIAGIGVAVNLIMGVLLNQSSHMHSHSHCQSEHVARGDQRNNTEHSHNMDSLAVRAAFIHALGDLVQSVGVLVAAYIIRFKPLYKIADPICTYIFSFLVLCTTFRILRDTGLIFLEGTPRHLDVHRLRDALLKIDDVHSIQRLNVWSLTVGKTAAIVHLKLIPESFSRWEDVQCQVQQILLYTFGMHQCTVQVQVFKEAGNNVCTKCRSLEA
ncbi:zinc transporter 4 [Chiloscyllium plagiosum]|uniref:zinc transporter 4 n=1 Tax=Chiloscyllium plagiosum TaxID=36176 RepID=UPI001CB8125D|nr:zinc transporter 4 [Chiloscyllium plagiosum]XP_043530498.1 zinc transporter 4 [Chiloscyllium plagiosum]XP_043530499.1 zinc transporter 4 [Chiloscyllium plagiosum]XP_043530500.1 zinc transporter 4 [Chiloscyllium plagiosum]